jgi:hypothetical protein
MQMGADLQHRAVMSRNAKSPGDALGWTSGAKQNCRMLRAKSLFFVDFCPHYIAVWGRFAASAILAGK